ncbi:hypothetical protein MLD38_021751 [Melastoma candidum]|uniref:Uncharacterized protein n=1 Tax=Melastoma candidum TaxID=119954 RepID=A0ACB9QHZ5_9MYRT|nr:hypothetical protein MLD38_021751 [Melastoma candidum]
MNVERLMKMAGSVRTGGKGTMRRKKKAVHKTTTTDDKRAPQHLEEDWVQASIVANTWVVSGSPQTKKLQDILPGIINQLGPDNLDNLRKLAEQFQKQTPGAGLGSSGGNAAQEEEDDNEVPELVPGETFEAAAEEGGRAAATS